MNLTKINELKIGSIETIIVDVKKYNFPIIKIFIKVLCEDETAKLDCFFLIVKRVILRKYFLKYKSYY